MNGVAELTEAGRLVFVVRDAAGKVVDSRSVQFSKGAIPALGTLPTSVPSANPSAAPTGGGTATPPATNPNASNGRGGQAGEQVVRFSDSGNVSSSYKINAPADAASGKVYGLHIHLHGDGADGYQKFPNKEMRQDLIGVAIRSPNDDAWGREYGVEHARYVDELIQKDILSKYNIDRSRIYFSGVSGGAYFLSGHFIPLLGAKYNSGAMLLCGGMKPQVRFAQPEMLKTFRIHWEVTNGERSDIRQSINAGLTDYKAALTAQGVAENTIMTTNFEGAGGHCVFDGSTYSTGIQFMLDKKFTSIVK
jgi:hypothetical protein